MIKSFEGCFKKIVFAIIDDHNTKKEHNPEGNVLPFCKIFGYNPIQLSQLMGENMGNGKEEI